MPNWLAIYRNSTGQELRIPLTESNKQFFLETESGKSEPFRAKIKDCNLGELTHIRTVAVADEPPQPFDPIRAESIKTLEQKLAAFPTLDLQGFLAKETKLRFAIDRDFAGASLEQIQEWAALVESEAERLKEERKRAEPPPTFERFQLARSFRGRYYGDLFIDNSYEDGSPQNGWNAIWLCRCAKCEASGPPPRTVEAQTLLEMEVKFRPLYSCEKPCRK